MRGYFFRRIVAALLMAGSVVVAAHADDDAVTDTSAPVASEVSPTHSHHRRDGRHDGNIISVGHDSTVAEGQTAEAVVSVVGS